jgi:hypothetical protein
MYCTLLLLYYRIDIKRKRAVHEERTSRHGNFYKNNVSICMYNFKMKQKQEKKLV